MADLAAQEFDPDVYQAFMEGYVRRINEATLRVPISGIKIGTAKYSRLAQINLKSGIITFSRFAIENVPERGRRYLVIHELSHVKEASHNKRFWEIVGYYEPNYRKIGRALDLAFKKNVQLEDRRPARKPPAAAKEKLPESRLFYAPVQLEIPLYDHIGLPANRKAARKTNIIKGTPVKGMPLPQGTSVNKEGLSTRGVLSIYDDGSYDCDGGTGDDWADSFSGVIFGGAEDELDMNRIWEAIT